MTEHSSEVLIQPSQVRVGVYVRIPLPWMHHPFFTSSFLVTTEAQVKEIQALGVKLHFDPKRSKVQPAPLPATPEPPDPVQEAEMAKLREQQQVQRVVKAQRTQAMADIRKRLDTVHKHFVAASEQTGDAFAQLSARPAESVQAIREVSAESTRALLADPDSAITLIADKSHSRGDVAHALSVMTLSLLLAKQLELKEEVLQIIGMGAVLHDVGKARISASILRNPDRNRYEELIYQGHCKLGYDELNGLGVAVPHGVLDAVLYHHERADGQGFPSAKQGADIPLAGRIVGIANRFDDLANRANPDDSISPFEALSHMWARERAAFDENLLQIFIRTMGIYPPGTLVQLSDGHIGVAVATAPAHARLSPQVLIYDPETPRREAIILDLADPGTAQHVKVERALRAQDRSEAELDYLLPRRKLSWYRGDKR